MHKEGLIFQTFMLYKERILSVLLIVCIFIKNIK